MCKKIVASLASTACILGMVACQQQKKQPQQATIVTAAPVVAPKPVTRQVTKPAPKPAAKPVVKQDAAPMPTNVPAPEPVVVDQTADSGGAAVVVAPVQAEPKRLQPLGMRVCHVPVKGMYVALTFDDGPHAALTPKALDILKKHGAKGTFFMLGQNANRNQSVVKRAAAEGHELGVHTWSHIKMNSCPRTKVDSEVNRTQSLLGRLSGTYPRVMRPPYGATNKTLVSHMHKQYGMASVLWDVDTLDWRKPGVSKVIATAVDKARPGSIILVHDIHASTISALEGIIVGLKNRGFKLVTVSEMLEIAKREAAEEAAMAAAAQIPESGSETENTVEQQPDEAPAESADAPQVPEPQQIQEPAQAADPHAASDEEAVVDLETLIQQ